MMEPDWPMDDDIAAEEEMFGGETPEPPPPPPPPPPPQPVRQPKAPPQSKATPKKKKLNPGEALENAFAEAKKKGHDFVYKEGALDFGKYRSCRDAKTFFQEYIRLPADRRAACEALRDGVRVRYFLDVEHKELLKPPTREEKIEVIEKTGELLAKLIPGVSRQFHVWEGSREITRPDGEKRFKFSLHMVHPTLACHNLAQAENITDALIELARKDEKWRSYAFYDTVDKKGNKVEGYLYGIKIDATPLVVEIFYRRGHKK